MTHDKQFVVKLLLKSLNLDKKLGQLINSQPGFKVTGPEDVSLPDLLIIETGDTAEEDMQTIQTMISSGEVSEVFVTADAPQSALLMQAMRAGVKEFLSQPVDNEEVKQALERFRERQLSQSVQPSRKDGRIVSIFGSKGGVGTTTIAVNLAVALSKTEHRPSVALLDMNTLFGEIPLFLEMSPKFHWGEITKSIERLDDTFLSNILTHHRSGIQVLPSPAYLNGHVRPTPDTMQKLLNLMERMFDYVIVDTGQSTTDTALKVLEISDRLMLVTILSLPCLANTSKLLKSFTDLGYVRPERIEVLLNRHLKKGEISIKDAEAGIGKPLYWTIPNDYGATMAAINNGKPLLEIAPRAPISRSFARLANSIVSPRETDGKKKRRFFNR
jgi:pilus assembly protein CpaE